ncbi:MAG: TolC family protein [Muribaculaceae bacterium]|nr:TolC family protein [Muribaculaceae bacterium]
MKNSQIAIIAIISSLLSLLSSLQAQAAWSLDSCINYAMVHNIDIRQRLNAARQGELAVTEAKDRVLPNVSGYGSQNFSFGRGLTADNTYANRNTNSFSLGAQLSVPLFQGLRVVRSVKYSQTSLKALVEQSEAIKDDVAINVMVAFLQALYSRETLGVARMSLEVSKDELNRREILLEAGKIPELDLYEARAQVSRDMLTVVNAQNDSVMALLDLSNLLDIENDGSFDILPLPEENFPIPSLDEVWANMQMSNHTLRAAVIRKQAAGESVDVAKTGYIPTLSFNAGFGTNYYRTSGFQNEGFAAQMRHNFSQSLGFSLNIPIFDGFSTRNSISRARLEQLNSELELDNTRQQLYKTISTAHAQAIAAREKEKAADVAVENTKAAFDAMTVKYDNGRANATEYEKSKTDYINAIAERLQARYERQLRIRILRHYNK